VAGGTELSFAVALGAGLLSFASPCVLPLVPAYLGQLTAVAVAASAVGAPPSRWTALRHATAYVLGFGIVFTVLGVTATFAAAGLAQYMPDLRKFAGLVLIVLGLSMIGVLRIPFLERTWRPLDAGASAGFATARGGLALAPAGGGGTGGGPSMGDRLGTRLTTDRSGLAASFLLGTVFAVGWTPCIGPILGGILGLASQSSTVAASGFLLVGYTLGLGLPFLAVAAFYDRAQPLLRPLIRHGRTVTIIGGLLVIFIGLLMLFDVLYLITVWFPFNTGV
jgi:cytochrome c-type biogenesis protein